MIPALNHIVFALPIDYRVGGSGLLTGLNVQGPAFDGAGFDFSYPDTADQVRIRDTVTAANNYRGAAQGKLTYTSPSVKNTRRSDGFWAATNGTTELPYAWDDTGRPIGLLVEDARTNLCLRSSDITNASWTKVTMTTAKTATGPNGTANYATTCTASGANATALQAIVSVSNARTTSMFVKRRTGTGTINITQDNGTLWTVVTVTSDWTQVQSTTQTTTNPTVGFRIVTSGDAIDVAWFQHELGLFPSSPIETTTASVTRADDQISIATSALPYSATLGTVISKSVAASVTGLTAVGRIWQFGDGTANEFTDVEIVGTAPGTYRLTITDGGVNQASLNDTTAPSLTVFHKTGSAWAANDSAFTVNGGAMATPDLSVTLPTVTNFYIGKSGHALSRQMNGYVTQLTYIKRRLADAELQQVTRGP